MSPKYAGKHENQQYLWVNFFSGIVWRNSNPTIYQQMGLSLKFIVLCTLYSIVYHNTLGHKRDKTRI